MSLCSFRLVAYRDEAIHDVIAIEEGIAAEVAKGSTAPRHSLRSPL
jgi:hypothetical protein